MPKDQTSQTKPHLYLLSEVNVAEPKGNGKAMPRAFSGVANSGKPFYHFGMQTVVDLDNITYHDKVPALVEHDRSQRAGFGKLSVTDNQLVIKGTLLDNDHGNTVADDADAGFPWQMSAHVIAGSVDEVNEGQTTVNGQTVTAPILILRNCRVPEVSFTPTGVDSDTSAVVLSDDLKQYANQFSQPSEPTTQFEQKDSPMTLEQALAKIAELEKIIAKKDETIEEMEAEKEALAKEKHEADVEAQLSQAGFAKSEDGKTWQGVSEGTVNVLLSSDLDSAKAIIADLKPMGGASDNPMPEALLGEQFAGVNAGQGEVKLSNNPLLADAQARKVSEQAYI